MPPLLLPVVAAVWCKHLGRPWHEAMRMLLLRSCDADVPLAALRWQWACGLLAGVEWARLENDTTTAYDGFTFLTGLRLSF
jgi:deoxyribodipyrimidine photolyase